MSKLDEIKARFEAPYVSANHRDWYSGISEMPRAEIELLLRATYQLGVANRKTKAEVENLLSAMPESEEASTLQRAVDAINCLDHDVLELIAADQEPIGVVAKSGPENKDR